VRVPVHTSHALAARNVRDVNGDLGFLVSRPVAAAPALTKRDDLCAGAAVRSGWACATPAAGG
jgi:hypothetical protein